MDSLVATSSAFLASRDESSKPTEPEKFKEENMEQNRKKKKHSLIIRTVHILLFFFN